MPNEESRAASRQKVIDYFGRQGCILEVENNTTYRIKKKPYSFIKTKIHCLNTKQIGLILLNHNENILTINLQERNFYETIKNEEVTLKSLCPSYTLTINYTPF